VKEGRSSWWGEVNDGQKGGRMGEKGNEITRILVVINRKPVLFIIFMVIFYHNL